MRNATQVLAQLLWRSHQENRPASVSGALRAAQRLLAQAVDPVVYFEWYGQSMALPLSHDLPLHRARFPGYADNLIRLAARMEREEVAGPVIDIGANIGDSAVALRSVSSQPILCVEGDSTYAGLLAQNVAPLGSISIEPSFLDVGVQGLSVSRSRGTGSLVRSDDEDGRLRSVTTISWVQLLEKNKDFKAARLVKSDTDGWDLAVLHQAGDWLRDVKPVLFLEYAPLLVDGANRNALHDLEGLQAYGYRYAIAWDNKGDLLAGMRLDDHESLCDLDSWARKAGLGRYLDYACFADRDADLAASVRAAERRHAGTAAP